MPILDKECSGRNGVTTMWPVETKIPLYKIRHLISQIFQCIGVKCLNQGPQVCMRGLEACWMGTAYLAGLCAGTSQHNIPSTSLLLHVLGLIVRGAFSVFIMLLEVKWHSYLNDFIFLLYRPSLHWLMVSLGWGKDQGLQWGILCQIYITTL